MDYVELHARSAFSFLRGASIPEDLVAEAGRLQLPGLALLDRDGVYGAPRLYQAARDTGVRAFVGAEITMEDGSVVPLLVANPTGYRNLSRLISTAKLLPRSFVSPLGETSPRGKGGFPPGEDPRARKRPCFATWKELAAHADGLIALSGDEEGPVLRAWRHGGSSEAGVALRRLQMVFGDDHLCGTAAAAPTRRRCRVGFFIGPGGGKSTSGRRDRRSSLRQTKRPASR